MPFPEEVGAGIGMDLGNFVYSLQSEVPGAAQDVSRHVQWILSEP